uniref:PTS sugar transporter subunit IIA n=1 Tax=Candidatus Enterococcus willemsii TaxID=1857215 RepID=UPI00403F3EE4
MKIDINVNNADEMITTYQEAITFAGKFLLEKGNIVQEYIDACVAREKDFPTGLLLANGVGIAMPHGDSTFVKKDSISLIRTKNAIAFGRMEDNSQKVSCQLIFNLALASGQNHIQVLRKLITLFQNDQFIKNCHELSIEETIDYIGNSLG